MQGFPARFTAGDSFSFDLPAQKDNFGNEISSANGWDLSYYLRGNVSGATVDLAGSQAPGGGWTFAMTSANSAKFTTDTCYWSLKATKGSEKRTIAQGTSKVSVDLAAGSAPYNGASQAEKDLLAVQAAMRSLVSGGAVQRYSVSGRSVDKMTMADLLALETKLKTEVAREKQAAASARGERLRNSTYVRFR